jgi:hypothetical protein
MAGLSRAVLGGVHAAPIHDVCRGPNGSEDRGGFDWADAGIGAAGGVALSVLSAGLALLIAERRERQCEPKEG